jgi:hypothetical protein
MEEKRMLYRQYKKAYADCKIVPGTYDSDSKTVVVLLPEGRMKPSGVRGDHYLYFIDILCEDASGKHVRASAKAMSWPNAEKQFKAMGLTPIGGSGLDIKAGAMVNGRLR